MQSTTRVSGARRRCSLGLLLPCNVVVRASNGESIVEILDPQVMVNVADHPELEPIADEATRRLDAVLDALRG